MKKLIKWHTFLLTVIVFIGITISSSIEENYKSENIRECQNDNSINIWYGDVQSFGKLGRPQRWINVLGNICEPGLVKKIGI